MVKKIQVSPNSVKGDAHSDNNNEFGDSVFYPAVRLIHPLMYLKYIVGTVCVLLLVMVFRHCYQRYSDRATKSNLAVLPTGEAEFVEMTVCPAYYSAYKEVIL